MNPIKIIDKYYDKNSKIYKLLMGHSNAVAKKALEVAKRLNNQDIDLELIYEGAMLHDIGIFLTNAPKIHCLSNEPYIRHGILGKEILEKEGLPKHSLICERHIGVGLTAEDIKRQGLPLPERDMAPKAIEEKIIAFSDNFFSKGKGGRENSINEIKDIFKKNDSKKIKIFEEWCREFKEI